MLPHKVPDIRRGRLTPVRIWLAGAVILGCFVGWELVVASHAHTHAGPAVATAVAAGVSAAIAWLAGRWHPALPVGAVAVAVVVADLISRTSLTGRPHAGPVGYGNADGMLDALGVAAAVIAAVSCRRWWRLAWIGLGVVLCVVAVDTKSASGAGLAIVLLILGSATLVTRLNSRVVAGLAGLAIVLVVALTVVLGHAYQPGRQVQSRLDRIGQHGLTYRRIELWHDAIVITASHPVLGVGPQRFAVVSPTARSDRDARWAHSGFLQQSAEAGIPGALLLAALFGWALVLTGVTGTRQGTIAAAAVGALGMYAGIDYVLHFIVVSAAAGAVVGSAAASISPPGGWRVPGRSGSPG